ncbi:putative sorting nexin-4 [Calycina marina]|uniref:Sorting nexin-4 n=1 Tax=Calycina marina TaxID=1763456 RepID=A0A9P8CBT5_9HELO|nr:putative sorting nexin-4 [Calycina marina]
MDLAGVGQATIECTVTHPLKEGEGSKDAYMSYEVITKTNFPTFSKPVTSVRRRFTDFVFVYNQLCKDYAACAIPPIPDKHKLEYVRGDRFGTDFTQRRANSLGRFLTRLTMHPILRRTAILIQFLESNDWNATMRIRGGRTSSASDSGATGVFDNLTDSFINAFTKVHKPDKRFIDVREKSDKLDEDLGHVEKVVVRVTRREGDLETDYKDLAEQFQKLVMLEPGVEQSVRVFAASVEDTSAGMKKLKDHTDQDYLGSLRDMQAYSTAVKGLLRTREQKQLDFEQLTEYLTKATSDHDILQSTYGSGGHTGPSGFIRAKIEDVRGVDHEQSRRERLRKLEVRIGELTKEVEQAKVMTEAFDEEVVREVEDFERIKKVEFRTQFGALADAHVEFYGETIENWEAYVKEMESLGAPLA